MLVRGFAVFKAVECARKATLAERRQMELQVTVTALSAVIESLQEDIDSVEKGHSLVPRDLDMPGWTTMTMSRCVSALLNERAQLKL